MNGSRRGTLLGGLVALRNSARDSKKSGSRRSIASPMGSQGSSGMRAYRSSTPGSWPIAPHQRGVRRRVVDGPHDRRHRAHGRLRLIDDDPRHLLGLQRLAQAAGESK